MEFLRIADTLLDLVQAIQLDAVEYAKDVAAISQFLSLGRRLQEYVQDPLTPRDVPDILAEQ